MRGAALAAGLLATVGAAPAKAEGVDLYRKHCSVCHQAGGAGVSGVYPRLSGRVPKIAAAPEGRALLVNTVLYGMAGRLEVDGKPLMGVMPGFKQLSDEDVAAVLTYVASLGGTSRAFSAAEAAAARANPMTAVQTTALARALPDR